jgi:hypothetical protein
VSTSWDCYTSTIEGLKALTNASIVEACEPLSYFITSPGSFHAVVTIKWSIHLAALFVHPMFFDQALSLLDSWTCEWLTVNLLNDPIKSPTNGKLAGSIAIGKMGNTSVTWTCFLKEQPRPNAVDWACFTASLSKWISVVKINPTAATGLCVDDLKELKQFLKTGKCKFSVNILYNQH